MRAKAKLRGGKRLGRALRKRGELAGLEAVLASLGADFRARAEANLEQSGLPPALTRRLKKSLRENMQGDGNYTLSSDDPLAMQVENGTLRHPARPWLLPALMDTQKPVRERIRALIKK